MKLKSIFPMVLILVTISCASHPPDFIDKSLPAQKARLVFYRPHVMEAFLADYIISLNGIDRILLKNKGLKTIEVEPGELHLQTRHFQRSSFYTSLKFDVKPGNEYFIKLDPDIKQKFSWLGLASDVIHVSNIVGGLKAKMKFKAGQGGFKDNEDQDSTPQFGHHISLVVRKESALKDLKLCCSSKNSRLLD